jgi:hypothetical protein
MAHPTKVSSAIQAALNDINLLRPLVNATEPTAAYTILSHYQPSISLTDSELAEFWKSLKHGVMTMDARTLVDYFDCLQPPSPTKTVRGRPQEWTP